MKKLIIITALTFTTALSFGQKIKGSDTVLPLAQKEAESYMKLNPKERVNITGGGSGVGLAALVDGTTDIAMASRKIKMSEKLKLQDAGKASKEIIIAYDALAVVVNPSNKVTQLTREQLESIYTGKTKNWKELGGDDLQIVVYSRETSSGTYEFFKEHVMSNKNYAASVLSMPATGAIIQSVSQTKGAIGYVGLAYIEKDVKPIKVSYDKGRTYIAPSMASAIDKTYPVVRPLYYYYLTAGEKTVKPFIDYTLSVAGQKIVQEVGYVPLAK
ncbi:MAG: phosphate ABC transporter substrate-binding protein [Bacteroidia bacterium]